MFKHSLHFLFLWIACLALGPLSAQTPDYSSDEKQLVATVRDFAKAYSNVGKSGDKAAVLSYLAPIATSVLVTTNIVGKVNYNASNYKGFSDYLDQITSTKGMEVRYNIDEIDHVRVDGNSGTVVYSVTYENIRDGEVWDKGEETVMIVFRKMKDDWKIIHYTVAGFENEKNKGACLCEMFASASNFIANIKMPMGKGYETANLHFNFTFMGDTQVIKSEKGNYNLTDKGDVFIRTADGTNGEKIGKAQQNAEVVRTIVRHLFKGSCTSIQFKS